MPYIEGAELTPAVIEAMRDGDPAKIASAMGMDIIFPKNNELFIDIDDTPSSLRFYEAMRRLRKLGCNFVHTLNTPSKSGDVKRHMIVKTPWPLTPMECIAWQAALGSDRDRTIMELLDLRAGKRTPTCFFEVK